VKVLCLNAGSSSLKAAGFVPGGAAEDDPARVFTHHVERIDDASGGGHLSALATVADACADDGFAPDAVAHRFVHGGAHLLEHCLIDDAVRRELDAASAWAPNHTPAALGVLDAASARYPDAIAVACFDTAFHRHLPPVARRLPIPDAYDAAGVHRYGFHGLSYEHLVHRLGARLGRRAVLAHLGSGASLAAVLDGVGVDTTMGLTPSGGLVMGTRTGDLDPGVLLYLQRAGRLSVDEVEHVVDHLSGLLGVSGRSADVRDLLAARDQGDADAGLALDLFVSSAARHVAALTTALGGLDTLVFTAGVGEHAAPVRAGIAARLSHLGVTVDPVANDAHAPVVSPTGAAVTVRVEPTDEELVMARHARRLAT